MKKKEKTKKKFSVLRIVAKIVIALFVLLLLLLLFIRSPWGQDLIVQKLVRSVSEKTGTTIRVEKVFIAFDGNVNIDGLYLEDLTGDTLVYSQKLEANIPLWPLISGDGIAINSVNWEGLTAKIIRKDSIKGFNYQFLIDAYASSDTTTVPQDTTATKFDFGGVHFQDFDLKYDDAVSGTYARTKFQNFELEMEQFDLEKMQFHVNEVTLANADIIFEQRKALPETQDSTTATMPFVSIEKLTLNEVKARYQAIPDGMNAKMNLGKLVLKLPKADLSKNEIVVDQLVLEESDFLLETKTEENTKPEKVSETENSPGFQWPDWNVNVNEISFSETDFSYFVNGEKPTPGIFNTNAIEVKDFHLQLDDFSLRNASAKLAIEDLGFTESSGIHLKKMAFESTLENEYFSVDNLFLSLNENLLEGSVSASYSSLDDFFENPTNSKLTLKIPRLEVALKDVFIVQPSLKNNEYLLALSKEKLTGNLVANGTLSDFHIPSLNMNWGQKTAISARGNVKNGMDTENIQFDFPRFDFVSARSDIIKFVNEDSLGIAIPEKIELSSSFRGSPENIVAEAKLIVPEGKIDLAGSFKNTAEIAFELDLQAKELDLGTLLKNEKLGKMTLTLKTKGKGANMNTLDAVLESEIVNFSYNDYAFENLNLQGKIDNGSGDISMDYGDQNLEMEMKTAVKLDSVAPVFDLHLDLKGANLQALGISSRDIRAKIVLDAIYKGKKEGFEVEANTTEGVVVFDQESFLLGNIKARAHLMADTTSVDITNKILNLQLRSNAGPADVLTAVQNHVRSYISEKTMLDSIRSAVKLQVNATVSTAPILNEVLLPDLQRMDTVKVAVDFDQSKRKLDATVSLPFIDYNGNQMDSLQLAIVSNKTDFEGRVSFDAVSAGPVRMERTGLSAALAEDRLNMDFESYANDSLLVNVHSYLNAENDSLFFHIDPKELLLNGKTWDISPDNMLVLAENFVGAEDFRLHRNNQELTVNTQTKSPENQLSVGFENFPLAAILGFLNAEEPLVHGKMAGNFVVEAPFGHTGIIADLNIHDFVAMNVPLGNLSLKAESAADKTYDFNLGLSGGDVLLDLTGNYVADSTAAKLDMVLDLKKLKLDAIKNFTDEAITDTEGFISGNFQINGTTTEPNYEGIITFNEAKFKVSTLNANFEISDETIQIDPQGLYFDRFEIADENSSGFVLDGTIGTESFTNPTFYLGFVATNFTALNSTEKDNALYYGKLVFDLDGKLTGDLNVPIVDLTLDIASETNLTYVVPPSEIGVVSRDGIVVFVNKEDPDNILTRNTQEKTTTVTGIVVNSVINIKEGSVFSVILNEKTGDNLQIAGEGSLNFDISANGRTHLAGRYNIKDGHYTVNLYKLIKRRFDIVEGSSISWFGEPLEANLDITAVHEVETSAASLMAAQTSGTTESRFQQELTFLVYLYLDEWLMQPKLSFGIGMPEDERGALGGQVYGTVQQLNEQESELNKQVFSLLVLNRFYPQGNSYGAEGGALTLARDNVNQLLSDQLNMFSDKLMGDSGVNLNFGLDSYTDYQGETPQERTALEISAEKRFFDDRLVVEVGSAVDLQGSDNDPAKSADQPFVENINIQYLLTEDGRFRLKGFRKNTFENVIDGQVIINGIALIFQKQFNSFEKLWKSEMEKEVKEKKEREKKKERKEEGIEK